VKKAKFEKFKYEIISDLPSAMAHSLKFDGQDFSSGMLLPTSAPPWRSG
jgi:hypothetical protein